VGWFILAIPATQEAEVGGSRPQASSGKSSRPYLKKQIKSKGTGSMTEVVELLAIG
jgi:hypothetical protein